TLSRNPFAWNRHFGLLFVDSPLSTGFSTASSLADIPTNQPIIAEHILTVLQSFYALNLALRTEPFFLTGGIYMGKYIPTAGAHILDTNRELPEVLRVNLRGGGADTGPAVGRGDGRAGAGVVVVAEHDEAGRAVQLCKAVGLRTPPLNRVGGKAAMGACGDVAWEECSHEVGTAMQADVMCSVVPQVESLLLEHDMHVAIPGRPRPLGRRRATEAWPDGVRWDGL
ncbi:hypothetical protein ACJX0J_005700, partial [Zea mays]